MALVGGLAFFVTFFTLIAGPGGDSIFGYGFFPGFLALTIWSTATSIASHRTQRPVPASRPYQWPTPSTAVVNLGNLLSDQGSQ